MQRRSIFLFAAVTLSVALAHGPPHMGPPGHHHGSREYDHHMGPHGPPHGPHGPPHGHPHGPPFHHHHDWPDSDSSDHSSDEWSHSGPDSGSDSSFDSGSWEEHDHHHHPWDSHEHKHQRPPHPESRPPFPKPSPGPNNRPRPNPQPGPNNRPRPNPQPGPYPFPGPNPQPRPNPQPGPYPFPGPNPQPRPNPQPGQLPLPNPNPFPQPRPSPNGDGQYYPKPKPLPIPNLPNPGPNPIPRPTSPRTPADIQMCMRNCPVTPEYNPVCGSDGVTYNNLGRLECARNCGVDVRLQRSSRCPTNGGSTSSPNTRAPNPANLQLCLTNCPVTSEYNPVCGSDGVTYSNPGRLDCAKMCGVNVQLARSSQCPTNQSTNPPITNLTPSVTPSTGGIDFTIPQEELDKIFTKEPDTTGLIDVRYERDLNDN